MCFNEFKMASSIYSVVAQTSLPLRVIPSMRTAYDDIIVRQYGDRMLEGKTVLQIIKERKLVEPYPYTSPLGCLYSLLPPEDFPARVGLFRDDGILEINVVPMGTHVGDMNRQLKIPEGYRMFWFRMVLRGQTLQTLSLERLKPLRDDHVLGNVMQNGITVGYMVRNARRYMFLKNSPRRDVRIDPGPPLYVLPMDGETIDVCLAVARSVQPYTTGVVDHREVRAYESFISLNDEQASLTEFAFRTDLSPDECKNTLIFVDGSTSDIMACVQKRAKYIQMWQQMERNSQDFVIRSEALIRTRSNETRYKITLETDGRLVITYLLDTVNRVFPFVSVLSLVEFEQHLTSPAITYDTESIMCTRLGLFDSTHRTFDSMNDSMPSHLDIMSHTPEIDAVWNDDTLYIYQKEGVAAMVQHELTPDGLLGMYLARMSGQMGQPGLFRDMNQRVVYIDKGFDYMGGFLCDDTGMGKTRQVVSLIKHTRPSHRVASLVVVTPTILHQWISEIRSTWPEVRLLVYYSKSRTTIDLSTDIVNNDIVITTYSTYNKYMDVVTDVVWDRVVFDEAHSIPHSVASHALRRRYTWFLTATPEVQTERLLSTMFRGMDDRMVSLLTQDGSFVWESRQTLWRMVRPLVIRRTRARHLDIPDVHIRNVTVELSQQERNVYDQVLESVRQRAFGVGYINILDAMNMIRGLQNVATTGMNLSPVLIPNRFNRDTWFHPESRVPAREVPQDDCSICIGPFEEPSKTVCGHWFCRECIGNAMIRNNRCPLCRTRIDPGTIFSVEEERQLLQDDTAIPDIPVTSYNMSTKTTTIMRDIKAILDGDPTDRILVFFDTRSCLDVYAEHMKNAHIPYTSIHGGVSVSTRSRRISQFQYDDDSPHRVMLLTVKTASAGITLTRANHILVTTPTVPRDLETQMIGRAHRLGQRKPVYFTRYVALGTVEEPMVRSSFEVREAPSFLRQNI